MKQALFCFERMKYGVLGVILLMAVGCTRSVALPLPSATITFTASALPPTSTAVSTRTPTVAPTETPAPLPTETPAPPTETSEPKATIAPPLDAATPAIGPDPAEPVATALSGADGPVLPGQHAYTLEIDVLGANGLTRTAAISYLLYLPGAYGQDPQQQWPLVLFLHGSDVWGNDPEALVASGLPERLTSNLDFPAIVLSPQAPEDVVWWGAELDLVRTLLDQVQARYSVDTKRIYLTGFSTGGFGAWAMAARYPHDFAALAPVAGGWNSENDTMPRNICDLKNVPIWVFHGAQDDIVLPKKAQLMVDALKQCGSDVRLTLYPDANHRESSKRAYAEPELYAWLFEQHLP